MEAMLFAASRKFAQAIFETDSLMLVQSIESSDVEIIWAIEADVLFIKSLLLFNSSWSILYISRIANSVAGWLAKQARLNVCPVPWQTNPPVALLSLLSRDFYYV
ncbi:conserved hypothetical protein [Ricinus communis]|uniref:RNase H type-1 domain-containing protein n=1 Tax=Ricinus communis TaxID=3988 RepID=B9S103_RICCO|nr:conserved hypothetical protein [Ricinus communis]